MSLTKQYKTDSKRETEGVPITFAANEDGTVPTFYIARMSGTNTKYARALEIATRPHRRQIQLGTFPAKQSEVIMRDVFIRTVLTGWQNVLVADVTGETLPDDENGQSPKAAFNEENAGLLFDRLPELYAELQQQAQNMANFLDESLIEEAKN